MRFIRAVGAHPAPTAMELTKKQIEKYKATARKHGLILREIDIMYLRAFMNQIAKEEIRKIHETKFRQ